jgi:hypothetical protein
MKFIWLQRPQAPMYAYWYDSIADNPRSSRLFPLRSIHSPIVVELAPNHMCAIVKICRPFLAQIVSFVVTKESQLHQFSDFGYVPSTREEQFQRTVMTYLGNFARYGTPNGASVPRLSKMQDLLILLYNR